MPSVIENYRIKDKCQVFTPVEISNQMLDLAGYTENLYGKKVLENSCGNGEILSIIVERYICDAENKHYSKNKIKVGLEQDIFAYEIDDNLIVSCKERLNYIAAKYSIKDVHWNIQCSDFLSSNITENFEFIIGNPPYIAYPDLPREIQIYVKEHFNTCKRGKFDYSYAFIEKSYNILSSQGCLVYIIPSNIFKNVFAENLRHLIQDDITTIIDFPNDRIFKKVLVSPSIIKVVKNSNAPNLSYIENNNGITENRVFQKSFFSNKWSFNIYSNLNKGTRLGEHFKVSSSIATLFNDAFILKNGAIVGDYYYINENKIEVSLIKKAASPKNKKYKKYNEYIIFPYYFDSTGKLQRYSEEEMVRFFPCAMSYLEKFKNKLKNRDADRSAKWYEYGRSQALQNVNKKMILVSSVISDCTEAYMLEEGEIPYSGLYIIQVGNISLETLLDKLNSKGFKSHISNVGVCVSGNSKRVTPSDIENYIF